MADFKIGSYIIQTLEMFNKLKEAGVTSDEHLAKIDKNKDMKISEDELQEVLLSEDDEEETEETKKDDSSGETDIEENTMKQIMALESQISDVSSQLNRLESQMATSDELDKYVESYENLLKQRQQLRNQIFNLLYKAENTQANSTADATGVTGTSTGALGAAGNTQSKAANYAIQFDGKSASEMQQIMTQNGCRFDAGAWCADFVTFATKMANGGTCPHDFETTCPNTAYCPAIGEWAQQKGLYTTDVSKVQPGDFILYGGRGSEYHIGIVTAVNADGTVDTIEGNTSDDNGNYTDGVVNQHSHVSSFGGFVLMH